MNGFIRFASRTSRPAIDSGHRARCDPRARGMRCRGAAAGRRMRQSRRPRSFESRPAIAW